MGIRRQEAEATRAAHETEKGDQYTFIALASSAKAIISYRTGKRDSDNTDEFMQDLRERVIGTPEISARMAFTRTSPRSATPSAIAPRTASSQDLQRNEPAARTPRTATRRPP